MDILYAIGCSNVCHYVSLARKLAGAVWSFVTDNYIGIATVIGIVIAFFSYRFQRRKPVLRAVAIVNGDWATATITVTNTGDRGFSVKRIGLDLNGDSLTVVFPPIQHMRPDKLPHFLECGASIEFDFFASDAERISVNIRSRVVLELSDGVRLVCDGCVLRQKV